MINLYASYADGKIGKADGTANDQLMILAIILAVVWALLTAMFIYYLWQFKKTQTKAKIFGWPWILGSAGLSIVMLICWALNLPFYLKAESIFGQNGADTALTAVIVLFVVGYLALIVLMIGMWFFINHFAVGFDDQKILFIGEKIMYNKITKVIKDENKHALYVNYTQGRRTIKRQKFNLNSVLGQFVLKNINLTGHRPENGDEKEYFKKAISGTNKTSIKKDQETK